MSRARDGHLTIWRLTHYIPRRPSSFVQRILMEGSFSVAAIAAMTADMVGSAARPDAILYIGAQPSIAMVARLVSMLIGRPYFVNVTDLAAQAALDVGIVGNGLSRMLEAFEFAAYRKAAGASVLCQSFADALVTHGYPGDRIRLSRDPTDLELIRPVARDQAFRCRYGIAESAFVVMYAGSMGRKTGLINVLSAAERTRGTNIRWVLVGEGEMRAELVEAARQRGLDEDVRFVPFQPDAEMSAMFAAADVLLLNQIRAMKDTVIPSKLLTYMASGRPVLAAVNSQSQAADIIREAQGGRLVAPEDPEALADAARSLATASRRTLDSFGANNRAYAEEHFDQRKILKGQEQFLVARLAGRRSPARELPDSSAI
jgi:putative colanic acid biosynthesis glycosyltransferase WcaI